MGSLINTLVAEPVIDTLQRAINGAEGVRGAIEAVQELNLGEVIKNPRTNEIELDKKEELPDNLVGEIKDAMKGKTSNTKNMAEALDNAVKERVAGGENIKSAIIDDNGYEIRPNDGEER